MAGAQVSAADQLVPLRAAAQVADGRTVVLHELVHPDLWEDRPVLEAHVWYCLQRTAELHEAGDLVAGTLTITRLEPIPELAHLRRDPRAGGDT